MSYLKSVAVVEPAVPVDKLSFERQSAHMHVLALALASALAVEIAGPEASAREAAHPAPWYLPRTVSTGLVINHPAISVDVRLAWEIGVIEQPRNHLVIMLAVGTGTVLSPPKGIRDIYQHTAMLGFGYRSNRERFHWGFSVLTGPLWYRASYQPGVPFKFENRLLTYSEASAQAGLRLFEHLIIGLYAGYGAPWDVSNRFPSSVYLGGFRFGFFADWR